MCGINGIVSNQFDNGDIKSFLTRMNESIIHRGPDEDGIFVDDFSEYRVGLGMRRLSIIDLKTGHQPMYSNDRKIVLVFNGEIYNYRQLKYDLEKEGVQFSTTSDTEVILRLYERYGINSFSKLDGMYAFSLYDENCKKIFIARDFFGEKPLYYVRTGHTFAWASELKSLLFLLPDKKISLQGLNLYFQLTYIPAPFTIYKDVHKLEPNHYLEFDCTTYSLRSGKIEPASSPEPYKGNFKDAKTRTQEIVRESVISRSISDVPLGTFLSGGVDSSIVSLCLSQEIGERLDTFSVGFEKKSFDETDKSRTVAKLIQSNHHEFVISEKDLKQNLSTILINFDEPFADSSALATYLVSHKTREFVKVALTGDGGDEVFGGYNKYYIGKLNNKYTTVVPNWLHDSLIRFVDPILKTADDNRGRRFKMRRLLNSVNFQGDFYYNIISLAFTQKELEKFLTGENFEPDPLEYFKMQIGDKNKTLTDFRNIDRLLSLEGDMLAKVDRTSMLTSLETRAPFLNKKLWNFTSSLPENFLMHGWNKKFILKEAFKEFFPEKFLDKSKKGFGVPVGDWLRGHLKPELLSYIEHDFLREQEIFNIDKITTLVERHADGVEDNTFRVWTFFCFQKWYKTAFC